MTAPRDTFGRPIVVVTGMGIVTSLGAGKADNWKKLTAGESGIRTVTRFPIDGLKSTMAGTVDFVTVEPSSSTGLTERLADIAAEEALAQSGIGRKADFPGPLFLAVAPVEVEWPQRIEVGRVVGKPDFDRRRSACDQRRRTIRKIPSPLHVRLGGRTSGRKIRHQGIADLAVDRLRVGRHRDPARRRGHSPRRNRCCPLRGDRRFGQPGSPDPVFAAVGAVDPERSATGNVAVPTECVKNASRRSTIQAPSTPASTASSRISTSARCM